MRRFKDWTGRNDSSPEMTDKTTEELLKKLAATMAPVFDAQRQLLGLMMELRVAQNDMDATKLRVEKIEAMLEKLTAELAAMRENAHARMRQFEADLNRRADMTHFEKANEEIVKLRVHVGKLITGIAIIQVLVIWLITQGTK